MAAVEEAVLVAEAPIAPMRRSLRSPIPSKKRDLEDAPGTDDAAYATRSKKLCLDWAPLSGGLPCKDLIEAAAVEEEEEDVDYVPSSTEEEV